jgi:hypothetical protein
VPSPANDDGDVEWEALASSLRHFAIHGLGAARAAFADAQAHWHCGDQEAMLRSLEICRAFDNRLARRLETHLVNETATTG